MLYLPQILWLTFFPSIKSVEFNDCKWINGNYIVTFIETNIQSLRSVNITSAVHKNFETIVNMARKPLLVPRQRRTIDIVVKRETFDWVRRRFDQQSITFEPQVRFVSGQE